VSVQGERIDDWVRAHSPYVAGLAYRLLGRDADVDDIVQDVFVALLRHRSQIREPGAVRGWLATTTVRLARKRLRKRALRELFGLGAHDHPAVEPTARGATQEEHLALRRIHRALAGVPANARVVWLLRYVEQERMEEVARLAGCSLTTAKRRVEAAQNAVKRALGQ
jgi:RNA polymerase sigma-70 factor (ECF subfamily)